MQCLDIHNTLWGNLSVFSSQQSQMLSAVRPVHDIDDCLVAYFDHTRAVYATLLLTALSSDVYFTNVTLLRHSWV